MEHSTFLEVVNRSVNQEMPHILWNAEFYCHVHTIQLLDSTPSQVNQDQFLISYSSTIHLNMQCRCYATMARSNMRCLVRAGKLVNDIRAIARQPAIRTIEGLLEAI
jgi:hypothetical protein